MGEAVVSGPVRAAKWLDLQARRKLFQVRRSTEKKTLKHIYTHRLHKKMPYDFAVRYQMIAPLDGIQESREVAPAQ